MKPACAISLTTPEQHRLEILPLIYSYSPPSFTRTTARHNKSALTALNNQFLLTPPWLPRPGHPDGHDPHHRPCECRHRLRVWHLYRQRISHLPALAEERRKYRSDPVESDESDVDEDGGVLDHAPNWANGLDADMRQGLKFRDSGVAEKRSLMEDTSEECKLVLVVRTDLGMTKGTITSFLPLLFGWCVCVCVLNQLSRQNRCSMLPRHPRLLQGPRARRPVLPRT